MGLRDAIHVCVLDGHGDKLGERGFSHGGAGLAEMAVWVLGLTKTAAEAVHVAIGLRECSRIAEDLTQERTRLGNRMREQLWRYYPQMLGIADDIAQPWLLELWARAPTPDKAARLRQAHDRLDRLTERLAASGDAEPGEAAEQRDVTILASLPGVGRIVLATLLAEAFDPLQRRDDHALRCL